MRSPQIFIEPQNVIIGQSVHSYSDHKLSTQRLCSIANLLEPLDLVNKILIMNMEHRVPFVKPLSFELLINITASERSFLTIHPPKSPPRIIA